MYPMNTMFDDPGGFDPERLRQDIAVFSVDGSWNTDAEQINGENLPPTNMVVNNSIEINEFNNIHGCHVHQPDDKQCMISPEALAMTGEGLNVGPNNVYLGSEQDNARLRANMAYINNYQQGTLKGPVMDLSSSSSSSSGPRLRMPEPPPSMVRQTPQARAVSRPSPSVPAPAPMQSIFGGSSLSLFSSHEPDAASTAHMHQPRDTNRPTPGLSTLGSHPKPIQASPPPPKQIKSPRTDRPTPGISSGLYSLPQQKPAVQQATKETWDIMRKEDVHLPEPPPNIYGVIERPYIGLDNSGLPQPAEKAEAWLNNTNAFGKAYLAKKSEPKLDKSMGLTNALKQEYYAKLMEDAKIVRECVMKNKPYPGTLYSECLGLVFQNRTTPENFRIFTRLTDEWMKRVKPTMGISESTDTNSIVIGGCGSATSTIEAIGEYMAKHLGWPEESIDPVEPEVADTVEDIPEAPTEEMPGHMVVEHVEQEYEPVYMPMVPTVPTPGVYNPIQPEPTAAKAHSSQVDMFFGAGPMMAYMDASTPANIPDEPVECHEPVTTPEPVEEPVTYAEPPVEHTGVEYTEPVQDASAMDEVPEEVVEDTVESDTPELTQDSVEEVAEVVNNTPETEPVETIDEIQEPKEEKIMAKEVTLPKRVKRRKTEFNGYILDSGVQLVGAATHKAEEPVTDTHCTNSDLYNFYNNSSRQITILDQNNMPTVLGPGSGSGKLSEIHQKGLIIRRRMTIYGEENIKASFSRIEQMEKSGAVVGESSLHKFFRAAYERTREHATHPLRARDGTIDSSSSKSFSMSYDIMVREKDLLEARGAIYVEDSGHLVLDQSVATEHLHPFSMVARTVGGANAILERANTSSLVAGVVFELVDNSRMLQTSYMNYGGGVIALVPIEDHNRPTGVYEVRYNIAPNGMPAISTVHYEYDEAVKKFGLTSSAADAQAKTPEAMAKEIAKPQLETLAKHAEELAASNRELEKMKQMTDMAKLESAAKSIELENQKRQIAADALADKLRLDLEAQRAKHQAEVEAHRIKTEAEAERLRIVESYKQLEDKRNQRAAERSEDEEIAKAKLKSKTAKLDMENKKLVSKMEKQSAKTKLAIEEMKATTEMATTSVKSGAASAASSIGTAKDTAIVVGATLAVGATIYTIAKVATKNGIVEKKLEGIITGIKKAGATSMVQMSCETGVMELSLSKGREAGHYISRQLHGPSRFTPLRDIASRKTLSACARKVRKLAEHSVTGAPAMLGMGVSSSVGAAEVAHTLTGAAAATAIASPVMGAVALGVGAVGAVAALAMTDTGVPVIEDTKTAIADFGEKVGVTLSNVGEAIKETVVEGYRKVRIDWPAMREKAEEKMKDAFCATRDITREALRISSDLMSRASSSVCDAVSGVVGAICSVVSSVCSYIGSFF